MRLSPQGCSNKTIQQPRRQLIPDLRALMLPTSPDPEEKDHIMRSINPTIATTTLPNCWAIQVHKRDRSSNSVERCTMATTCPYPVCSSNLGKLTTAASTFTPKIPAPIRATRIFKLYGEAMTAADGSTNFRTILPGHYELRPGHIQVKVKFEGQELLTTQFFFGGDAELAEEGMFNRTGGERIHLIIRLAKRQDAENNSILVGQRDITLDVDSWLH